MTEPQPEDPAGPHAAQIRIARPTDRLDEVVRFYEHDLGLPRLGDFSGHAGYTGVMLGLPDQGHHLEFTTHVNGSPCPAPTQDNLLVLYFAQADTQQRVVERLRRCGHEPVPPENPYWAEHGGTTFEDPDGWRVVLMPTPVF